MRRLFALCFCLLLAVPALYADSKDPAEYPLRVHIYAHGGVDFYHREYMDEAKGEGRANVFENGVPHGIDYTFECDQKLKASFGYETYPAKWKKPGRELTVLMPVFGQTGHYFTCTLKTDVKDYAYGTRDSKLVQESVEDYRAWMIRTDYDPEHGKNVPRRNVQKDGSDAADPNH